MKTLVASLFALALGTGCAADATSSEQPTFDGEALATIVSDGGALTVEVRTWPAQPPARGESAVELRVSGEDGTPEVGLVVMPGLWMPDMGHGASIDPTMGAAEGEGRYVVEQCELFMPGRWDLRADFSGAVSDRAVAHFEIP